MPLGEATASVETDAAHLKKLRREKAIWMSPCRVTRRVRRGRRSNGERLFEPARQDCAHADFCQEPFSHFSSDTSRRLGYDFFISTQPHSIADLQQRLDAEHYVADRGLAVSLFLALRLKRPLFLEGEAGVGKTALAAAMAKVLDTDLIRLQCYEGLDVGHAVYEWDYPRQLLELRILDATHALQRDNARRELYSESFLIKRPLLQAIDPHRTRPAVLLIDEIDRADEE